MLQELPQLSARSRALCGLCHTGLEARSGRSVTAALACALGTFVLLVPGNVLPLIQVHLFGMHAHNRLFAGIAILWHNQWTLLAALSAAFAIVLPFVRFGLLSAVLGALRLERRPQWLGPAFRWAVWLDQWAMADVFLLAGFVGYYRLIHALQVSIDWGGYCYMAAAFLTMISRAALDRRTVWRAIAPETAFPVGEPSLSCTTCDLVQPLTRDGEPCPRCGARLHLRKPAAMTRTAALTTAAFILFFPANILPMNTSMQMGHTTTHTIFNGVRLLFEAGLWPLGVLIFCTSILIPVVKIAGLGWCMASVHWGSRKHLVTKTRVYRVIDEIGRWSNVDPFTIVFFVPLMNFGSLASADAAWGATAFMLVVVLTMLASRSFDPRLMWDAAQREYDAG